jgi:uncharacterized protein YcbX
MKHLTLSELWIYPIKSLGGIRLTTAKVLEKGLQFDRRWMLIDANGIFMTQRIHNSMALFKVSINHDEVVVTKKDSAGNTIATISFAANAQATGPRIRSKVWDDEVDVVEVDSELSKWFSLHLNMSCKLVHFPESNARPVDAKYKIKGEHVSLADAYPFLIVGQSSLTDLNNRLKDPVPMNRFRPNFVFSGGDPFEEDGWKNIMIGKNRFAGVKNCSRCVLITVDQETSTKAAEPLYTLSTYRKRENKVYFGQNLLAIDHFEVSVGDIITLQ